MEYACAATNVQIYSAGEETQVAPNMFEEVTIIGSRSVYKINAEISIGQPRLWPTTLERPSPSRRGTVIPAPETLTSGNEPVSMRMPNIDDRDLGRRVDVANGAQALTKSRTEQWTTGKGEMMKETRRKASLTVGSAGMK